MTIPPPRRRSAPTAAAARARIGGALAAVVLGTVLVASGAPAFAQQTASPAASAEAAAPFADPVALGEPASAGDALVRVLEVATGEAATAAILAADPTNSPPRDGVTYVLVRLAVENRGEQPLLLSNDDFALTGASGLVRRFLWLTPPEPALPGEVAPGETGEGWIVLSAPVEETGLVLLYDNLSLGGDWADRALALEEDADLPSLAPEPNEPNATGRDPAAPAGFGEPVVTEQWRVELVDVATGAAVFDLVDYRTGALRVDDATGASDGSVWLALRFRIANAGAGDRPATLPANAFALTDLAGTPILDLATLTPPSPDAAGDYFPGAEREGWVAFDVPVDLGPVLVRFQPYAETTASPDPRYFTPGA